MATTSLTLVGNSVDSPQPILRPLPATGRNAEMLEVYDPDLGDDAKTFPYKPSQREMKPTFRTGLLGGYGETFPYIQEFGRHQRTVGQTLARQGSIYRMESEETELTVLFAVPLDHTLFAEADVLGYSADIAIGNRPARLELPRARHTCSHSLALQPPNSAPDSLGLYLEGKYWGLTRERGTEVELEAVLIAVPIRARLGFPLAENQIGGDTVRRLLEAVLEWYDSLIHWIWVVTAQSLDPTNPDPKVVNRRSRNIVLAARAGDVMSFPTSGEASMTIVVDLGSPKSERLVNRRVLDYIVPRVGNGTPTLMWELLASARMAARRGDVRRALIDAGTAAESALSVLAPPAPKARPTLGTQVKDAPKKGIVLPSDTWTVLVEPRNHAIHRGQWSPGGVDRALEIAEDIVALADPAMPRASSLPHKFRPQRNDIKIIRPPHQ